MKTKEEIEKIICAAFKLSVKELVTEMPLIISKILEIAKREQCKTVTTIHKPIEVLKGKEIKRWKTCIADHLILCGNSNAEISPVLKCFENAVEAAFELGAFVTVTGKNYEEKQ